MRGISLEREKENREFALRAAKHFEKNPKASSFTDDEIEPGCKFALRWGLDNNCVLVLHLHEFEEVVNYYNVIEREESADAGGTQP